MPKQKLNPACPYHNVNLAYCFIIYQKPLISNQIRATLLLCTQFLQLQPCLILTNFHNPFCHILKTIDKNYKKMGWQSYHFHIID